MWTGRVNLWFFDFVHPKQVICMSPAYSQVLTCLQDTMWAVLGLQGTPRLLCVQVETTRVVSVEAPCTQQNLELIN